LAGLAERGLISVTALFDPDPKASIEASKHIPVAVMVPSFDVLLTTGADMVLLAGPAQSRHAQALAAIHAGLAVFCEKPLASTGPEASEIVATAVACSVPIGVGLIRRQFPAARSIAGLLANGTIGPVLHVDWFEGGPFEWPVGSPAYFDAPGARGVLADIGTHVFDLLAWWLGPLTLADYADDAMGGVEANAAVRLEASGCSIHLRLSRDWARPNRVVIDGQRGRIVWETDDLERIILQLGSNALETELTSKDASLGTSPDFVACYARQLEAFAAAIGTGAQPASGPAGLAAALIVDECYAKRHAMDMAWLSDDERAAAANLSGIPP
jgi:predicted dehydrogenase